MQTWSFWIVTTKILDKELGDQKSLGEGALNQLTQAVTWSELSGEFKKVLGSS